MGFCPDHWATSPPPAEAEADHYRADGCGTRPDRDDLLRDCDAQTEFRARMELLRRNAAGQIESA